MSQDQPTDARARLQSHFLTAQGSSEHGQRWDSLWADGFIPWDNGTPNPAFVDLLTERPDLLPQPNLPFLTKNRSAKKALVPGCGKGYDVLLLAAFGYEAYGLEFSANALEEARKVEKEQMGKWIYEKRVEGGSVNWVSGDFFKDEFLKEVKGGKFDVIYDYTFLSALPPSMRPAWSKRFNELLTTDGRAICVEFPTYKPASTGGPPWALPPKIYLAHLPRPGVELPYGEDGELQEDKLPEPNNGALERITHFQPKRTNQMGYDADGKVTDWVSVWGFQA